MSDFQKFGIHGQIDLVGLCTFYNTQSARNFSLDPAEDEAFKVGPSKAPGPSFLRSGCAPPEQPSRQMPFEMEPMKAVARMPVETKVQTFLSSAR